MNHEFKMLPNVFFTLKRKHLIEAADFQNVEVRSLVETLSPVKEPFSW